MENADVNVTDSALSHPFVEIVFAYCVCLFVFTTFMIYKFFSSWGDDGSLPKPKRERRKKVVEETPAKKSQDISEESSDEEPVVKTSTKKGPGRPRKIDTSSTPSLKGRRKVTSEASSESSSDSDSEDRPVIGMKLRPRTASNTPRSTPSM